MASRAFALGGDVAPVLDMYARYRRDPESVPIDWRLFLEETDGSLPPARSRADADVIGDALRDLLAAYRAWGHGAARLDPLRPAPEQPSEISEALGRLAPYGSHAAVPVIPAIAAGDRVDEAAALLHGIYAGSAALESSHIGSRREREWLQSRHELAFTEPLTVEARQRALATLVRADEFEDFFRVRFPTKKRFGIEGAESFLVLLDEIIRSAAGEGVGEIVIGGMHRGRLNMLANAMGKPLAEIIAEVKGRDLLETGAGLLGDVPYHLGYSGERAVDARSIRLSLAPHPSHLLAVAPVVLGKARGKQMTAGPQAVMPLLLHTDAAFCGQGLTSELLQLGGVAGFTVGGTIHVVVNNQLGFTTIPADGRSSRYCTDIGKMVEAPILHVNADDPDAVVRVAAIAAAWRTTFRRDIIIDLVCYRRNGHNELDEPRFTQPGLYDLIDAQPPVRGSYASRVPDGEIIAAEIAAEFRGRLDEAYHQAGTYKRNLPPWLAGDWSSIRPAAEPDLLAHVETGVSAETLRRLGRALCDVPDAVTPNSKVSQFLRSRLDSIERGDGIGWATAEALALATLLDAGVPVRISGQDVVRGTFTQRHWALHDTASSRVHVPLRHLGEGQAPFEAINSPLSEYAVLGFEYGHSLVHPHRLTVWEAQFGDFANGAQIVIDQFIVAGEAKWMRMSGLVMLLPHGPDGQGPEHSSARIERFLQLCAGGNICVVNCSTPANFFHVLRRQVEAAHRKPLVVIAPKSLLRNKACASTLGEMGPGTAFAHVIEGGGSRSNPAAVARVLLCSGKVAYDLERERERRGLTEGVAVIRVEQLYPFPADQLIEHCSVYGGARLAWCQEEPENQGAWEFVRSRISDVLDRFPRSMRSAGLARVARPAIPAPAAGSLERHEAEQELLVRTALCEDLW